MIAGALPAIEDCHDCADFILVPLLWCRKAYGKLPGDRSVARIDRAILGYRYWMDEPGNDVQWYFSENHALLFHTAAYLAGHMLPEATFVRSGRAGREQSAIGAAARARLARPFREMGNGGVQLRPVFPDRPQGPDRALRAGARRRHLRARRQGHRAACSRSSRVRPITASSPAHRAAPMSTRCARRARSSCRASAACFGARAITASASMRCRRLALCLRDHGLTMPAELDAIASVTDDEAREWTFAQGQDRFARALPLQDPRPRDGECGRLPLGPVGLSGDRAACCDSEPTPMRNAGSTIPARCCTRATGGRPTGAARARCRACTSIARSPSSASPAPKSSRISPMPGSRTRPSTNRASAPTGRPQRLVTPSCWSGRTCR